MNKLLVTLLLQREREGETERKRERESAMSVGRYVRFRRNSHPSREPN